MNHNLCPSYRPRHAPRQPDLLNNLIRERINSIFGGRPWPFGKPRLGIWLAGGGADDIVGIGANSKTRLRCCGIMQIKMPYLPVDFPVPDWSPCDRPPRTDMVGRYCRLEPLDVGTHAHDLYRAYCADLEDRIWTYLSCGPFDGFQAYRAWVEISCLGDDPQFHAVIDMALGKAVGVASYMRIDPDNGVMEVGNINYSPALQRSAAGTEAMYLMMKRAFDELGYRRYEWKCDNLNAGSKRAAARYGFTYEGLFRQALIYKGRNRDTAWFAIIDKDWSAIKYAFEAWLSPVNIGEDRRQNKPLSDFIQM